MIMKSPNLFKTIRGSLLLLLFTLTSLSSYALNIGEMEVTNPMAGKINIKYHMGTSTCQFGEYHWSLSQTNKTLVTVRVYIDNVWIDTWGGQLTTLASKIESENYTVTQGVDHDVKLMVYLTNCNELLTLGNHHHTKTQTIHVGNPVSNLAANVSGNSMNVSWNNGSMVGATYNVRLEAKNNAGLWATTQLVTGLPASYNNHTFNNIIRGQQYRVQISQNLPEATYSDLTTTSEAMPASWKITNMQTANIGSSSNPTGIKISWNHPTAKNQIISSNTQSDARYILKRREAPLGTTNWSSWTTLIGSSSSTYANLGQNYYNDNSVVDCKTYEYTLYYVVNKYDLINRNMGATNKVHHYPENFPSPGVPEVQGYSVTLPVLCQEEVKIEWDDIANRHECITYWFDVIKETQNANGTFTSQGYIINSNNFNNGPSTQLTPTNNKYSFTDNNVTAGTTYKYSIRIVGEKSSGGYYYSSYISNTVMVEGALNTTSTLTSSINNTLSNESITINWTDNNVSETGFTLIRTNLVNQNVLSIDLPANTTTFVDNMSGTNPPAICTEYSYEIQAYGCETVTLGTISTESGTTNPLKIQKSITDTYATTALKADKGYNKDVVNLEWTVENNSSSLNSQEIWRKELNSPNDSSLIATVGGGVRSYADNTTLANTQYQYFLKGNAQCGNNPNVSNIISDIGFRSPYGIITGNIEYTGGLAVADCKVNATGLNQNTGSIYFDGDKDYVMLVDTSNSIDINFVQERKDLQFLTGNNTKTIELWLKPEQYTGASVFRVGTTATNLSLRTPGQNSSTTWQIVSGGQSFSFNLDTLLNEWHHFAITYDSDTLRVYHNGSNISADNTEMAWAHNMPLIVSFMTIGSNGVFTPTSESFKGNMTEIRFWSDARTEAEINRYMHSYLEGNEDNLEIYYRTNEQSGKFLYDASFDNNGYHRRDADITKYFNNLNNASFSTAVPAPDQLGAVALTDNSGNYFINRYPYSNTGEIVTIVPFIPYHQFQPNSRTVFLGNSTPVANNQDFTDISAFDVTGVVFYGKDLNNDGEITDGSNGTLDEREIPAEGLTLYIDGQAAIKDGQPIYTDENGEFEISVPIGDHFVSVQKPNHEFEVYRFPETGYWNFQAPVSGLSFIDKTQVTLIGKIAGGAIEAEKEVGFNNGINNIGVGFLQFKSVSYPLYRDTVYTDETTGEYRKELYPIEYQILGLADGDEIIPSNNPLPTNFFNSETIDFTNTPPLQTKTDSVFNTDGSLAFVNSIDFHSEKSYILRNPHTLIVTDIDGSTVSGEDYITKLATDGAMDTISTAAFDYDVYQQNHPYDLKIRATEIYVNKDLGAGNFVYDTLGAKDVVVNVNNNLATTVSSNFTIDATGTYIYSFMAGDPNTSTISGANDYTKHLDITSSYGNTTDSWSYDAYVIGSILLGSSFATEGPDIVEHILRDPPGSNSSTQIAQGATFSSEYAWGIVGTLGIEHNVGVSVGADFTIGIGLGTRTDIEGTVSDNYALNTSAGGGETYTQEITIEETISTSDDANYVGADGDLYIGKSYNMNFGVSNSLTLIPQSACDAGATCKSDSAISINGELYKIGLQKGFQMSPTGYNTYFVYSEKHIKEELIPDLIELRNQELQKSYYTVHFTNTNDPKFGTNNDDSLWAGLASTPTPYEKELADTTGPSYTFSRVWGPNEIRTDSVRWYNQQIRLWREAIAANEHQKINAIDGQSLPAAGNGGAIGGDTDRSGVLLNQDVDELETNISFSSGASVSRSTSLTNSLSWNSSFEVDLSYTLGLSTTAQISNTGIETEHSFSVGVQQSNAWSTGTVRSTAYEFTLADGDVGDFYSVDVLDGGSQNGPIFKIQGGQTSCPYEAGDSTEFYMPGTPFQVNTVQRDLPAISISPGTQVGIPATQAATFQITMSNLNPDDARDYALEVDQSSNPDGLILLIDGLNPNQTFNVPAGGSIIKTLTVYKGPLVYDYSGIKLILKSSCESSIYDEATFDVQFIPTCTPVEFLNPNPNWVLNNLNNDTLALSFDQYDVNFPDFEKVIFKYKASSSSTWIHDEEFFNLPNAGTDTLLLTPGGATTYDWDVSSLLDGLYDIQLETVCPNNVTATSTILSGTMDRLSPELFGQPSPADGILSPNDEIMITLNEDINEGLITSSMNFDIRGVLNNTNVAHYTSMYFDGTDQLDVPAGINLDEQNFTIEFWVKRDVLQAGSIFRQGASSNFNVGINASNAVELTIAGNTVNAGSINNNDWHHVAIINNQGTVSFMIDGATVGSGASIVNDYDGTLAAVIGSDFSGNIQELRIWNDNRTFTEVQLNYLKELVGNEQGLKAYWKFTEGNGTEATDYAQERNAVLNGATWAYAQEARSLAFSGSNHLEINSATQALSEHTDLTLSFWFKGTNGVNKTLFSNGKIDASGSGINPNAWAVYGDASGLLTVANNGYYQQVSGINYFDNNWHHFAISVNRLGNTNIYMDGTLVNTYTSANYAGFGGSKIYLAAYGRMEDNVETIDQEFTGNIDEFRLWNTARKEDQIARDRFNRLAGDEFGLLTYFPFESYQNSGGVLTLQQTLLDQNNSSLPGISPLTANMVGATNFDPVVPAIKFERPVQPVNFSYTVNNDAIIFTINEPFERIENTLLDITVRDIRDEHLNVMESAVTWSAYIDKNQVYWLTDYHEADVLLGNSYSFDATVVNSSGSTKTINLSNLPSWLTASTTSAQLPALSQLDVTFTVQPGLNIGNYQEELALSTAGINFNEMFNLKVNVAAQAPDWTVDATQFNYSMSIIGTIIVDNVYTTDVNDKISAYINNQLVGSADIVYHASTDRYRLYLDVYSNSTNNDTISFRIWDASEGLILENVIPKLAFVSNGLEGTVVNPIEFMAGDYIVNEYSLQTGWNWISINLVQTNSAVPSVFADWQAQNNDVIQARDSYDQYAASTGWIGSLSNGGGINIEESYKLKSAANVDFEIVGQEIDLNTMSISVTQGWNWIAYWGNNIISVNEALASLNPQDGDIVKGQVGFAVYDAQDGWVGSLQSLQPRVGYMLNSQNGGTLVYPQSSQIGIFNPTSTGNEELLSALKIRPNNYESNMSMIAYIKEGVDMNDYNLVALDENGNTVGACATKQIDGENLYFLTVYGTNNSVIHFELHAKDGNEILAVQEVFSYVNDGVIGSLTKAQELTLGEVKEHKTVLYPNPTQAYSTLSTYFEKDQEVSISLVDAQGKTCSGIGYRGTVEKGNFNYMLDLQNLSAGVYLLRIESNTGVETIKLTVQ